MIHVAVYGRIFGDKHLPYVRYFFERLKEIQATAYIYEPFMDYLKPRVNMDYSVNVFNHHEDIKGRIDYFFSIGGDGTFLESTALVRDSGIPIIGINTGRLGFLSGISIDEIDQCLDVMVKKSYTIDSRALLKLETESHLFDDRNFALNELTIHKKDSTSMISIHAYLNGKFLNSYWADGLVVATPTGSTAYSLSCGGPIIHPETNNFIITPIAPHNLNVRPIVIPDNAELLLKVEGRSKHFLVALDSRTETIDSSVELKITKANFSINMLHMESNNYLSTIRNKLNWGLDNRN